VQLVNLGAFFGAQFDMDKEDCQGQGDVVREDKPHRHAVAQDAGDTPIRITAGGRAIIGQNRDDD
jgi:hypothetical protein